LREPGAGFGRDLKQRKVEHHVGDEDAKQSAGKLRDRVGNGVA